MMPYDALDGNTCSANICYEVIYCLIRMIIYAWSYIVALSWEYSPVALCEVNINRNTTCPNPCIHRFKNHNIFLINIEYIENESLAKVLDLKNRIWTLLCSYDKVYVIRLYNCVIITFIMEVEHNFLKDRIKRL